jgi:4-alpha-glucanotransferase
MSERASGVLLHLTSLPGPHGIGDLGRDAHAFAERFAGAEQRWWQMLPVGPPGYGNSPYSALSAFAGNPLLVSLELLERDGLLSSSDLAQHPVFPDERVDYSAVAAFRESRLRTAFEAFQKPARKQSMLDDFNAFTEAHREWLDDFALYTALKRRFELAPWSHWPPEYRDRVASALDEARRSLASDLTFHRFEQWLFDRQWRELRAHATSLGLGLIGDLPIFVAHDSADVWANREHFFLDDTGQPTVIAGVPPDYFSATGQRWGNPLYRWEAMKRTGYRWWLERFRLMLSRFDAVRLDHFIGFERYWEIPASEPTAIKGQWRPGPSVDFFQTLHRSFGELPLIAEDLGEMTPEVHALRDRFELPGIRILQFAFGTDPQAPSFLPHAYPRRCVVYTGTHDNDTTAGWFHDPGGEGSRSPAQTEKERRTALDYLGTSGTEIHWEMIRMTQLSVANLAITPVQDLLGLGSEARMNRPGTAVGNWEWRLRSGQLTTSVLERLAHLTRLYGRSPGGRRPAVSEQQG